MESLWSPQSVLYHNKGSHQRSNLSTTTAAASNRKRDREFGSGSSMSKRRSPDTGVPVKGFLRLDSLEGNCITQPTSPSAALHYSDTVPVNLCRQSDSSIGKNFHKFSPTRQESRWFANGGASMHTFPTSVSFQTPLNLGTGEHEVWSTFQHGQIGQIYASPPMSSLVSQGSRAEYSSLPNMSSFVSNIFGQVMDTVANISCSLISNLNPNARSFTPLNPNAKEFTPSSRVEEEEEEEKEEGMKQDDQVHSHNEASLKDSSPGVVTTSVALDAGSTTVTALVTPPPSSTDRSECSTPILADEEHEAMKSVSMHQVTPWLTAAKNSVVPQGDEQVVSETTTTTWRGRRLSSNSDSDLLDDSIAESTDTFTNSPREERSVNRLLSTSSCSSEDSYVDFSSALDSPNCSNQSVQNCKLGRSLFVSDSEDDEDDDDDEEQDADGWDDVDDSASSGSLIEIPDEFKNCGLSCPMQPITSARIKVDFPKEEQSNSDLDSIVFESEMFPCYRRQSDDNDVTRQKLHEINERWNNGFSITDAVGTNNGKIIGKKRAGCERLKKGVKFSSPDLWRSYSEAPGMADELRASRISDYARRKADQERFERIIAPILTKSHREKVFQRMRAEDNL